MSNGFCNNEKGNPVMGCAVADAKDAPKPKKKEKVNPIIKPAKLTVIVRKFFNDAAGNRKAYTTPKRQQVVLTTDTAFTGTGTFTCSKPDKITFFKSASKDDKIRFDGTENVFKGAQLASGITLYAEGAKPSGTLDDVKLFLHLEGGSKDRGPDATAVATSVEVTVDICKSQPVAATAPQFSQDDKVHLGRNLLVQNKAGHFHRAKLIIQQVKPSGFKGELVLKAKNGHVDAFKNEKPKVGETTALPFAIAADKVPAAGEILWAQAVKPSTGVKDTGFDLTIKGVDEEGDKVKVTAVQLQLDVFKRRTKEQAKRKPAAHPSPFNEEDKVKVGRFVHKQDVKKSHERAMIVVRAVQPATFNGKLVLEVLPSTRTELFRDEDPGAAGAAVVMPYSIDYSGGKNEDKTFWVQGTTASALLKDVSYALHLSDDPVANSDVIILTVVELELTAKVPTTNSVRGTFSIAPPSTHHIFKSTLGTKKFADNPPTTLVRNTDDIDLEIAAKPAGVPIHWSIEANPGPEKKEPTVARKARVTEATLKSDASGGYSVIAAAGTDADAPVRWNIVLVGMTFKNSKVRTNKKKNMADTSIAGSLGVTTGVFNVADPTVCGMHTSLKATFEAGGDASLDTYVDKVHAGIVNVLLLTSAACNYLGPARERERILSPRPATFIVTSPATPGVDIGYPILDRGGAAGTRATGGNTIYLRSTRSVPVSGKKRKVETCDSPQVGFDAVHPTSGGNATNVSGVNQFGIFLVLYSDDANYTYVAFGSGDWTADYSGPVGFPVPGTPLWTKGPACGVTGSPRMTAIKNGRPADKANCEVRPPVYLTYIVDAR